MANRNQVLFSLTSPRSSRMAPLSPSANPTITLDRTANVDGEADIYYFFAVTYSNKDAEGANPFNLSIQVTSGTSKAAAIFDSESGRDLATTMSCPE